MPKCSSGGCGKCGIGELTRRVVALESRLDQLKQSHCPAPYHMHDSRNVAIAAAVSETSDELKELQTRMAKLSERINQLTTTTGGS